MKLVIAALLLVPALASADPTKLHVSTDIVSWDKPVTEAQCLEKGKASITAADKGLAIVSGTAHAVVGTKTDWVVGIDCLQSYKANAAYVTIAYNGGDVASYTKVKEAVSKGLGGKSELFK